MTADRRLSVLDFGTFPYAHALGLQRFIANARLSGEWEHDALLLVQHPPVITLGRSARDTSHQRFTPELLAARGVELFEVDRGGDVTFHGPGQLVGYPILDLKQHKQDLHWYLRQLEEVIIRALVPFGIVGERSTGQTGVWTEGRKIASIGVHAKQWVTWHGFALNVSTDLSYFDLMVPCGIAGVQMTSVEQELLRKGLAPSPELFRDVQREIVRSMGEVFALTPTPATMGWDGPPPWEVELT